MGLYDDRLADLSESRRVASRGPFAPTRPTPVVRGVVQPPARETSARASMDVQSLLFDRSAGWTASKAKEWARSHGYRHGKVHTTDQYIRIRQFDPKGLRVKRTITFGHGIRAVVAREEENMGAKRRRHRSTAKKAAHRSRRRAREVAAPVATEAKRRKRHRRTREAPVATEAKRRKRRRHRAREAAPVATEAKRRKRHRRAREAAPVATEAKRRRRHRRTREARRPISGQVMESPRRRKRRSHRTREAWHGSKAEHRKAAKKGWRKRKHGGGSRSAKRSAASKKAWRTRRARARGKFIGPVTRRRRKGHMFEEARHPRRRRHRAREVSEVSESRRRRKHGRRRHRGMFEARRGGPGRSHYLAELGLAIGTGSLAYILANGFDRFLATYNPNGDPAKLPKHKFTSDGAGTLANTLNIASHPSWLRIGAGIAMAAAPAGASVFVKSPLLRASLEGAAVGASVQLLQMLWSNVLVPLLAPKDTSDAGLKTSFIARLYPTEIAAHINAQTPHLAPPVTGLSGAADAPVPVAGVGQADVGPFALQGPSYFPSAVEALRAQAQAAGVQGGHESNRLETGIGYGAGSYPSVQELWRQASGGDTASGFRPSVQDVLTRTVTAVQGLAPAVQAAMPGIPPAQAEQVAVTALTQPNDIPGAIQQVFPDMPEEHRREFGGRLHHHVHHHHRRMRGGEGIAPPIPGGPGVPPPPGEMFGGLVEEAHRRFPHLRHEHHVQIAGHILTEPHNIVGALKRAMPGEPEHVLREHARHFHKHVAHVAEAVAPGVPPPAGAVPPEVKVEIPLPEPHGHVAGLGDTGLGYVMRGINSFGRPYSPLQSSQFAAHAYSQPWNLPGVMQRWMPGQTQQQYYDYGRRLHPYVQQQYGQQYGQQAGNLYSVVQQILPEVPSTQLQTLISQLEAAPYNMIAILQQVLPNVPEYLLQYRAQKLHPYFMHARPAPPTVSGAGVDQPPPLPNPGPPDLPTPGPNGKPVGEDCGCGQNDLFLGLAGVGVDGESAKEEERLILG